MSSRRRSSVLGYGEAEDLAVVLRVEAYVRVPYAALDILQGVGVEGVTVSKRGSGAPTFATLLKGMRDP